MKKKITIAVIGCGGFARNFVPLFKAHKYVEKVYVCDLIRSRAEDYKNKFGVEIIDSLEDALKSDEITAIACFAQRHLHGPIVTAALKAGKDVYSAVPMASSVEECKEIIDLVKETGRMYMMGETCVYYPCAMYCKQEYEKGTFGNFVYGESQYFHDLSHFPSDFKNDRPNSAVPPFFYPTHSTAMLLYATDSHVTKVTGVGYRDVEENTPFKKGENPWDNEFSNEYSLMQLSNGGTARVCECRRIGYKAPSSFISGFYGTQGAYQYNNAQHLVTKLTPSGVELRDVSDEVNPYAMTEHKNDADFKNKVANHVWAGNDMSPVQQKNRDDRNLSEEYLKVPVGHMYSHGLLIDDFCTAAYERKLPLVNAWNAARYTVPGLIAHESALRGGELMDVPDFGDPEDIYSGT